MKKPKGWVYVGQELGGAIKIGWSNDPMFRLKSLKCEALAVFRGGRRDEAALHARFAEANIKERGREWFRNDASLIAWAHGKGVTSMSVARVLLRVDPEVMAKIQEAARLDDRTVSNWIHYVLTVNLREPHPAITQLREEEQGRFRKRSK